MAMTRRSQALMLLTTFAVVMGTGAFHAAFLGHYGFLTTSRLEWELAYAVLLAVSAYATGLPDKATGITSALGQAVPAVCAAAVGISLAQLALDSPLLPRFVVGAGALLLTPAYLGLAALSLRERERSRYRERILVVGDTDEIGALTEDLLSRPVRPAQVVASVPLASVRGRGSESQPLLDLAHEYNPSVLVLNRQAAADDSVVLQAAQLHARGLKIRTLRAFYEEWMGKLPVVELERVSLMFDISELHRSRYSRVKRIVDVSLAVLGIAMLIVLLPVVLVVNALTNRGPLFFRQLRVGKGGKVFTMVKFRTCYADTEDQSWTQDDDPRLTKGGAWLRHLHIDEIPNVICILRGDMSWVGPRPEQPAYVEELAGKLQFYNVRHLVRPGLTGWAQVNYGYTSDQFGALQKLQYDFYYLRHQSLMLDLRVLGRTLRSVLPRA